MALFTGKGDGGTTKLYDTEKGVRISKASPIAETLGTLDEVNSFLGLCKVEVRKDNWYVGSEYPSIEHIIHELQEGLFIVQAEIAGAEKSIKGSRIVEMEEVINAIEKELPPINTFFISGGCKLSSLLDYARTLSRRAERRVVDLIEPLYPDGKVKEYRRKVSRESLAFLNRLSSVLYALARLSNHKSGIKESAPKYK
ncbi:MAG: cob(I)yrinic acid a,c-diamide adenosyltransferase [Candidatus Pacebacteria bacterium]|nr:cob(I)yrinic acid a,c-diamide adenosyltransferase [Candidatus Paceibacterota bacterium]